MYTNLPRFTKLSDIFYFKSANMLKKVIHIRQLTKYVHKKNKASFVTFNKHYKPFGTLGTSCDVYNNTMKINMLYEVRDVH